jgi:hypothetical protein
MQLGREEPATKAQLRELLARSGRLQLQVLEHDLQVRERGRLLDDAALGCRKGRFGTPGAILARITTRVVANQLSQARAAGSLWRLRVYNR